MARPKGVKNTVRSCQEKAQLVEAYLDSGIGYKRFAQERGISPSLFNTWVRKYRDGGVDALRFNRKGGEITTDTRENEILKLKLLIAEQQIEIQNLKKLLNQ